MNHFLRVLFSAKLIYLFIMSIALPMIECSSCGRCVGHLYDDYYQLSIKLTRLLEKNNAETLATADYSVEFTTPNSGDNWNEFLKPYFQNEGLHPDYSPENLVARSLLRLRPRTAEDFPLGKKTNGQRSPFEAKICCLRMFLCDSSRSLY